MTLIDRQLRPLRRRRTDRTVTLIDGRVEPECSDVELYKG